MSERISMFRLCAQQFVYFLSYSLKRFNRHISSLQTVFLDLFFFAHHLSVFLHRNIIFLWYSSFRSNFHSTKMLNVDKSMLKKRRK